ncbi:hypothetical protein GCM10010103_65630 [Streptomyces paradoxus]|uniref:Uncharacterized protein n=1 Tax=Streptomyces paradoxus TaxID=66375 RepID=A0A7W9TJY6_9ACTN|nr:hypothetical protein [Streptomyces paradoxus]MBB6081027.1 hypothetical protein [Streptomyces paradoxus]
MATSVIPSQQTALTASQAVALSLLRDSYRQRTITARTGSDPDDLYRLAMLHDVTAPHGTVEGHECHEARREEPCIACTHAYGRALARQQAQRRRTVSALPRALRPVHSLQGRRVVR